MKPWIRCVLGAVLIAGTAGCDYVLDPPHSHAGCTAWYDTQWAQSIRFVLSHTDNSICPLGSQYGDSRMSGAVVYDNNSLYSVLQGSAGNATFLTVRVTDYGFEPPTQGNGDNCSPPNRGTPVTDFYSWGQARPGGGQQYDWQAEGFVNYVVGDNPDYTCFQVSLKSPLTSAYARVKILYGTQF